MMQEMNSEETPESTPDTYSGYAGYQGYRDREMPIQGQKLEETFHDSLVQRIKQELQTETRKPGERFTSQRLMLALVSICVLVVLFGLYVMALTFGHLTGDTLGALGGAMFGLLAAIVLINAYFNFAGTTKSDTQKKKGQKEK